MILIQLILVICFLVLLVKFLANPNSYQIKAWKKIIGISFLIASIFAVLFPEVLNDFAHFLGVGRGADLLLYVVTLAFIFTTFNYYIASKQEQRRIIKLARKVAIIEANQRNI